MRARIAIAVAVAACFCAAPLRADPVASLADGRSGRVEFESLTPTGPTQLIRRSGAPKATVLGTLRLPPDAARAPAMVIAHGSGGVSDGREGRWAARFLEIGIASFIVDSFAPRGIRETATDQAQLSPFANIADALSALRLLATHPRIDAARIGLIGFSRGGGVALHTALEPVRRSVIDDELRFAVHVALYPPCATMYTADRVTGAPILFMLAERDDYTPMAACSPYIEWFRTKGVAVESIVYAGAHHGFDGVAPVQFRNLLQSARNCSVNADLDRLVWTRLDTNEILRGPQAIIAYYRQCGSLGATFGGNYQAAQKAAADLATYLKRVLNL
jgi:dienelactone hydrolase